MTAVDKSAYAGNWLPNRRQVVKYTPDCLVFVNGDTAIPGCARCRGRIEIQRFITALSVDAGTDPSSHSATITLSLPKTQSQQLFIDGHFALRPGLEINIYMRGYFPLRGTFGGSPPEDLEETDPNKWVSYPYYPVFHGVVTEASFEYSDGNYQGSLSCASLLHFWQYINISTSAAHLATKPTNDPSRPTFFGHNFNNMHPFGIIYTLYRDVAGAAAGVEFALSGQSNVDASAGGLAAAASDGGRQLYDHVTLYWEKRFQTRIQNLRMYGVNGKLFNSLQQAYLGSASNRDLQNLLPPTQYGDPKGQRPEIDPFSTNFSIAKAIGLADGGMDVTYSTFATEGTDLVNLNMLDMFAFTQGIGEVGTVNLWETTYQTKLDIVNAITEVTGYEFYQDVDGDLVFKPPFYNLDTSSNRIYRLEDIDIINISFQNKEPQATYINVRGTWFKGWTDIVPNDAATAKRSVYVDYKLVAKFGWRPASLEVSYTTDPRMLFYMGMARLDILNIDVNSATCSIPIRPELRPGYPVYIPFVDSFYYITQVSHSFTFGGQCTTSLTLTCRRSKFFAPGFQEKPRFGESAIWKIRLDRPDLPPRPLEVYANGRYQLVGFPNVVMALDPTKANPSFFPIGAGIEYLESIEDVKILFNAIREDIANQNPSILQVAPEYADASGRVLSTVPTEELRYRLQTGSNPEDYIEFGLADLIENFADLQALRNQVTQLERSLNEQRAETAAAIQRDNVFATVEGQGGQNDAIGRQRLNETILAKDLAAAQGSLDRYVSAEGGPRNLLVQLFSALQRFRGNPQRRKLDSADSTDVTAAYFESLMHLKSQYLAEALPGRYRYFSSAHPDPAMQGQPIIVFDDGERPPVQAPGTSGNPAKTVAAPKGRKALRDLAKNLNNAIENNYGIPGWSQFALAFIQEESRFSTSASNPKLGNNVVALLTGKGNKDISVERAQNYSKQAKKDFANNPYIGDPEHWGELGAAGWYQLVATTAMSGFKGTYGSKNSTIDPQQVQTDPSLSTAAWSATARRTLDSELWQTLPPEDKTWLNYRRAVGGLNLLKAARNRGYASKKWGVDEARAQLIDDSGPKAKLRFRSEDGDNLERAEVKSLGLNQAGRFLRGLMNANGLTLEQAVAFMNSPIPEEAIRGLPSSNADSLVNLLQGVQSGETPIPPPAAPPQNTSGSALPETTSTPSISIQDISIPPRTVVQFKETVTRPSPNLRYPEAELGLGLCSKGINLAQGPGFPPRPVSTDQIQTLSFARYSATKFAEVIGSSVGSGKLTLDSQTLFSDIQSAFMSASQNMGDPNVLTPSDVFQSVYDTITSEAGQVEIPIYQDGQGTGSRVLSFPPFSEAVPSPAVPDFLAQVFPGQTAITIATTTFQQISLVPGYASPGTTSNDGQSLGPTIEKIASAYALSISQVISQGFALSLDEASSPATEKATRLAAIGSAYDRIINIATGTPGSIQTEDTDDEDKTFVPGKIERPIHVPVFPVSDDKGYEHYGVYRYGRGLTVDPGGSFAYVHEQADPFVDISAKTAEQFLEALTLVKARNQAFAPLEGIAQTYETAARSAAAAIRAGITGEEEPETIGPVAPPAILEAQANASQNALEIQQVARELSKTPRGQEALSELLASNGDDPTLITTPGWSIDDTQFARNFSNFAANYALSASFKTTITNAAFQLADITSHLHAADATSCVCRSALSDVLLEAYSRTDFIVAQGVNVDEPGDALSSEQFVEAEPRHFVAIDSVSKTPT